MSKELSKHKKKGFQHWLSQVSGGRFGGPDERARFEAFLNAFPGSYCGWAGDGSVAYSQGFLEMLDLQQVKTITDIQARLSPGDAAALEGVYNRLIENGQRFVIYVKNHDGSKIFQFSGSQGEDPKGLGSYNVIWVEDATETRTAYEKLQEKARDEERYRKLFETAFNSIPSPRWFRNEKGEITWVNDVYSDAMGHTARDIIAEQKELTGSRSKVSKDKSLIGADLGLKALELNEIQESRAHVNSGGQRLLMKIMEIPLREYQRTLGVAEDISSEEQVLNDLKRYQASNIELLEHLRSAIAIYDSEQKLEFYNSSFSELWGLEGGWLNTKPSLGDLMEKLRENRRLPEQANFRDFKESWLSMFTSLIGPFEDMLYLPDGSAVRMMVIPHSMGGLMMTFEDVTSRLELESSYNTLIAVQKETLDNLGEGVAVYGGDGRLKLWNPAYGRLWNLNPEDLEGEPHINKIVEKVKGYFDPDEWPRWREELIAKALDRMMSEGRLSRANNTHLDYAAVPLPDGGVLITYSEVTDTVRVENALREKNAALEAAERLKLDFLANVSYQLRTPLNAIMGFNEILDQEYFGKLNEKQHEYTRDMHAASTKLLALVDDILDLATLEAGYMELQREDVSIYELMHEIQELVNDWARKGSVEIHLKCAKNIGKLMVDRKRLKQAVINVIRNAINFTPEGGTIELKAKRGKEGVEFIVTDTGVGVDLADRKRIFEPFERAHGGVSDAAHMPRGGAGLGLALVKNIVTLHGGDVHLESEPGKGTSVSMFVPCTSVKTPLKIPAKA